MSYEQPVFETYVPWYAWPLEILSRFFETIGPKQNISACKIKPATLEDVNILTSEKIKKAVTQTLLAEKRAGGVSRS